MAPCAVGCTGWNFGSEDRANKFDPAELLTTNDIARFANEAMPAKVKANHHFPRSIALARCDEAVAVAKIKREGLFDENMFAVFQRSQRCLRVQPGRKA